MNIDWIVGNAYIDEAWTVRKRDGTAKLRLRIKDVVVADYGIDGV